MARYSDWLPRREQDLADLSVVWENVLNDTATATKFGWDITVTAQLVIKLKAFIDARAEYLQEGGEKLKIAKDEAKAALIPEMRAFANSSIRWNKKVDNFTRIILAIGVPDNTRTPHIDVPERVELVLRLRNTREILVDFRVAGSESRAKPDGYDGAVIIWAILDKPPASHDELIIHAMASKSPFEIKFAETDRSKIVYVAAAWQNARGIIGAWSEIASAVVP